MSEKVRASLYALFAALFAVVGVYGVATKEQIAAWMLVVSAALNVLAFVNVPFVSRWFKPEVAVPQPQEAAEPGDQSAAH